MSVYRGLADLHRIGLIRLVRRPRHGSLVTLPTDAEIEAMASHDEDRIVAAPTVTPADRSVGGLNG
jgi:hypothetical protein